MKKYIFTALVLCLLSGASAAKPAEKELFRVSADAEVRVRPDRASVTFGVSEKVKDLKQGKEQMKKTINAALAFCKRNGVKDKYIQMDSVYISPRYSTVSVYKKDGGSETKEVLEYELGQSFTVTLEDLAKYELILYSLLDLGINQVESISFYSTQMRKYRDEARLLAIKHAQEKAALLTGAVGLKLGKVLNIREDSFNNFYYGGRGVSNVSQNVAQSSASGENADLAAGMISVKAGVTLTYEID